jgi:hypothetical protein
MKSLIMKIFPETTLGSVVSPEHGQITDRDFSDNEIQTFLWFYPRNWKQEIRENPYHFISDEIQTETTTDENFQEGNLPLSDLVTSRLKSAYDRGTSDKPDLIESSIPLPVTIQTQLKRLANESSSSLEAENAALAIADWLSETSSTEQQALGSVLHSLSLSPDQQTILMAAYVDTEVQINDPHLVDEFVSFLFSDNKMLAQAAASCLINCCGQEGKMRIERALQKGNLPHGKLIQGIFSLLS